MPAVAMPAAVMPTVQVPAVAMSVVQVPAGRGRPATRGVRPRAARRRRARHLRGVRRPRTRRIRAGAAARPPRCPRAAARRARGDGARIARAATRHREARRRPRRPARRLPAQASLRSGTSPRRRSAPLARTCCRHAPATNGVMHAHGSWARAADRGCALGPSGYRGAPIPGGRGRSARFATHHAHGDAVGDRGGLISRPDGVVEGQFADHGEPSPRVVAHVGRGRRLQRHR